MARVLISKTSITGEVKAYAGTLAPEGYLFCQGQAISRTAYSDLFAVLGTSHGQGDGSTTFNLPDYRGTFLRGKVDVTTILGSGTVASNNAIFTNHGLNRTGFKIRLSSGILSGLAVSTDYYAIVVDNNTLAFATSLANAIAGTKIAISGTNTAVIVQYEDPDYVTRTAATVGGNSAGNLGSVQADALQNMTGSLDSNVGWGMQDVSMTKTGVFTTTTLTQTNSLTTGTSATRTRSLDFDASRVARTSTESRPKNSLINYIIKY